MFSFGSWLTIPAIVLILCGVIYRLMAYTKPVYRYTIVTLLRGTVNSAGSYITQYIWFVRLISLIILAIICGQPRTADSSTKLPVRGIDIMLVLDFSGSMKIVDDMQTGKTRAEIAKEQAISFITRRSEDSIGLTVFGANALSRCPLTHDHASLIKITQDVEVGNTVIPDGTVISIGLVTALNRLKDTQSPSKIIILLTDGTPTRQDIAPEIPLELARTLGVKIYTIGIGSEQAQQFHPMIATTPLNPELLRAIAENSGGKFFLASNEQELQNIYQTIDHLEKRPMEINSFTRYNDQSLPLILLLACMMLIELLLRLYKRVIA